MCFQNSEKKKVKCQVENEQNVKSKIAEIVDSKGNSSKKEILLINDEFLNICIENAKGRRILGSMTCLLDRIDELIVGILYRRGIVTSYSDIVSINVNKDNVYNAYVVLKDSIDIWNEKEIFSEVIPIEYRNERIFSLARTFSLDTPFHRRTGATHSCILANDEKILFQVEDSGRHNAIDKAIGYALINEINLRECMLFTSARVSCEMVINVINAGIPVLISKAVPTLKAVEMAKKYKLSLLCCAGNDSFSRFN